MISQVGQNKPPVHCKNFISIVHGNADIFYFALHLYIFNRGVDASKAILLKNALRNSQENVGVAKLHFKKNVYVFQVVRRV